MLPAVPHHSAGRYFSIRPWVGEMAEVSVG